MTPKEHADRLTCVIAHAGYDNAEAFTAMISEFEDAILAACERCAKVGESKAHWSGHGIAAAIREEPSK